MEKDLRFERGIQIFHYFIDFLNIWGAENYGESAEVDWGKVYIDCHKFGMFDFNESLEKVVNAENEEEFRDLTFQWIENKVYEGLPIWRYFKVSKWLEDKLEEEELDKEKKEILSLYKNNKCFKCKYYRDNAMFFLKSSDMEKLSNLPIKNPNNLYSLKECYEYWTDQRILHDESCAKRKELLEEAKKDSFDIFRRDAKLEYEAFNVKSTGYRPEKWRLNPEKLNDCPYFEESEEDTFKSFLFNNFGIKN